MADKRWRLRLYNYGSTSLSTSNVYYQTTLLAAPPTVRGVVVRPREGRTEAAPWRVSLVDDGSSFTAHLGDSSGRLIALGRIVSLERAVAGSSFAVVGSGRVADILLNPNVGTLDVVVEDERRVERNRVLFNTSNTTRLFPPGPDHHWGYFQAPPKGTITVVHTAQTNSNYRWVYFHNTATYPLLDSAVQAIKGDLGQTIGTLILSQTGSTAAGSGGNFAHVRLRVGTHDYGIVGFGKPYLTGAGGASRWYLTNQWTGQLDAVKTNGASADNELGMWVYATSSQLTVGQTYSSAFLHMFSAPPSAATPLHLGTSSGLSLLTLLADIYGGSYSTAGAEKVRYSTAALDTLKAAGDLPVAFFRITSPSTMQRWLERNIFQPAQLVPGVDSQGRVAPFSIRFPHSTAGVTYTFGAGNLRAYPTWDHPIREAATVVVLRAPYIYPNTIGGALGGMGPGFGNGATPTAAPQTTIPATPAAADGLMSFISTSRAVHDRAANIGLFTLDLGYEGALYPPAASQHTDPVVPPLFQYGPPPPPTYLQSWYAPGIFHRFGDGPITGTLDALSSAESVEPGDWCKLALDTFPNPGFARGGTRFVQILSRDDAPEGPSFTYLDGGVVAARLTAPTLTLSTSTADPKHSLRATVKTVPASGVVALQIAANATLPGTSSPLWRPLAAVTSSQVFTIPQLPANTAFWARAQAQKAQRFRSAWTYSTKKTTGKLTAPGSLASTSIGPTNFTLTWTTGELNAFTDLHVDPSTTSAISSTNRVARFLTPGVTRYTVTNATSKTKLLCRVRAADAYGGFSSAASLVVTTSSGAVPTAPVPHYLKIVLGTA